jgi:dipeptidyl aminopeptidase/acylaminoacyl peptidase
LARDFRPTRKTKSPATGTFKQRELLSDVVRRIKQHTMKYFKKILWVVFACYLALALVGGVFVAEASLHLRRLPLRHQQQFAAYVKDKYQAELQEVSITASDATVLKAWYVHPKKFNGNSVVVLHGITDNREGVAGYGKMFLDRGYAVLLPDARDHGESGGDMATYGIREAGDIHAWVSWMYLHDPPTCVYGFGESYGAALMLQSLAEEPRYCAVAVESSFSSAREMSYERVSGPLHVGPWFGHTIGWPVLESALIYARLRYHVDLLQPSPLAAVRQSHVPVLLIHGAKDRSISPRHGLILATAAPDRVQLWIVPNADHTMAGSADHQGFEQRVLGWFEQHQRVMASTDPITKTNQ